MSSLKPEDPYQMKVLGKRPKVKTGTDRVRTAICDCICLRLGPKRVWLEQQLMCLYCIGVSLAFLAPFSFRQGLTYLTANPISSGVALNSVTISGIEGMNRDADKGPSTALIAVITNRKQNNRQ